MVAVIHPPANNSATRERYLGWTNPSESMIKPEPARIPIRTTVPLKNGIIIVRYDEGNRPINTALAGLFMVVLRTVVDIRAYMAEKISNRSKKAMNAST